LWEEEKPTEKSYLQKIILQVDKKSCFDEEPKARSSGDSNRSESIDSSLTARRVAAFQGAQRNKKNYKTLKKLLTKKNHRNII